VRWTWAALVAGLLAVAGCTSSGTPAPTSTITRHHTTTGTRPPPKRYQPPAPKFVHPLPPGVHPPRGEKDHSCPYIKAGLDVTDDTGVNLANIEGDRVYRVTTLTNLHPVGCRFYFYAPPYPAEAAIEPHTFHTAAQARDAMILTARTGHNELVVRNFVHGLTGISFQTKFFAQDGNQDWAFVFSKGRRMVVVYTFQTNVSHNALYIAQAIAKKF
jgi:hypothetical protein